MKKCAWALIAICVFAFSSVSFSRSSRPTVLTLHNAQAGAATFECGGTTLEQTIQVSGNEVAEGTKYAVMVTTKNVGTTSGYFSTNFLFIDPLSRIVDGGSSQHLYWLEPGHTHVMDWSHGFGCTGRAKGVYDLGVGTQPHQTNQACNYFYTEVELLNVTNCGGGFNP